MSSLWLQVVLRADHYHLTFMRVEELIAQVLAVLRNQHYQDRIREFKRDETALTRAIALYGHECHRRGWEFDAGFICRQIVEILRKVKVADVSVQYWPVYLTEAIKRHLGERAEELSAQAKSIRRKTQVVMDGVQAVVVMERTDTEVLAALYRDLRRAKRVARPPVAAKQGSLF